jgi:mRNA-degrading endonuclease HigB of HigAB toxin-antitoxin module
VVKPADLDAGIAVSADLRTPAEVRQAFDAVKVYSDRVLVEKHVAGRDYRLIPTCIDHDPRAHLRRPMVMMRQG